MKYSNLPLNGTVTPLVSNCFKSAVRVCFPRSSHRRERCTRFNVATKCTLVFLLNIWNCLSAMKKQKKTNVHHLLFFFSFYFCSCWQGKVLSSWKVSFLGGRGSTGWTIRTVQSHAQDSKIICNQVLFVPCHKKKYIT